MRGRQDQRKIIVGRSLYPSIRRVKKIGISIAFNRIAGIFR